MFDLRTQSQLVDATAAMMRSCVTATTKTWAASACHGLSLWAEMLGAGTRRGAPAWRQPGAAGQPMGMTMWPSMANWMTMPQLYGWPSWPWLRGDTVRPGWTPGTWPGPTFSLWMPLADWTAWTAVPAWSGQPDAMAMRAAAATQATAPAGFSSYRSGGGHAVAQIAAPATELVEAWRTALGV
jgi:hypothetical protein